MLQERWPLLSADQAKAGRTWRTCSPGLAGEASLKLLTGSASTGRGRRRAQPGPLARCPARTHGLGGRTALSAPAAVAVPASTPRRWRSCSARAECALAPGSGADARIALATPSGMLGEALAALSAVATAHQPRGPEVELRLRPRQSAHAEGHSGWALARSGGGPTSISTLRCWCRGLSNESSTDTLTGSMSPGAGFGLAVQGALARRRDAVSGCGRPHFAEGAGRTRPSRSRALELAVALGSSWMRSGSSSAW